MLLTYVLSPVITNSSRSDVSCYSQTYCGQLQQILHTLSYHDTHIRTAVSYNKLLTLCNIMLLTYVLSPVTTNSSRSDVSCYTHTYCRQSQQITNALQYHVTHIRTVASYDKFLTICHIMLLTYVLLPVTANSSHSAISCYSHTYCRQLQQILNARP